MQAISLPFVEIVADFKAKLDANEAIPIKTYYVGALKQSLIDDMVKNLNRRVRFLFNDIDFKKASKDVDSFCRLMSEVLVEVSDRDGKNFLTNLVRQFYQHLKVPDVVEILAEANSSLISSEDLSERRRSLATSASLET